MAVRIEIDPRLRYQTVEGFGASGAWWAQHVGGWAADAKANVVRLLFDGGPSLQMVDPQVVGVTETGLAGAWVTADGHDLAPVPASAVVAVPGRSVVTLALQAPMA